MDEGNKQTCSVRKKWKPKYNDRILSRMNRIQWMRAKFEEENIVKDIKILWISYTKEQKI